jgi:hypothetical protein
MVDPSEKYGGMVGGGMMILLVVVLCLSIYISDPSGSVAFICFIFPVLGFLLGVLGYIIGGIGAGYSSIPRAFFSGSVLGGFASAFIFIVVVTSVGSVNLARMFLFVVLLTCIFSSTGALIGGFGAIAARDYRRFQKVRFLPQFTLQELFIVITLVAVILSAIASWQFVSRH